MQWAARAAAPPARSPAPQLTHPASAHVHAPIVRTLIDAVAPSPARFHNVGVSEALISDQVRPGTPTMTTPPGGSWSPTSSCARAGEANTRTAAKDAKRAPTVRLRHVRPDLGPRTTEVILAVYGVIACHRPRPRSDADTSHLSPARERPART